MAEVMSAGQAVPIVSLETRADRWLLGLYFALVIYLIVPLYAVVHEGGHALGYVLAGYQVRGFFISPIMSQVFGLYPPGLNSRQGLISAAGPAAGLLLGYLTAWLYLRKRRSWGLWGDSALLMMMWATLMGEPGYLISGSVGNFSDPQQIAVHLGVSRWAVCLAGVGLVMLNLRWVRMAFARWRRTFAPESQPRQLGSVVNTFLLCIVLISIPYWIPSLFFIARYP